MPEPKKKKIIDRQFRFLMAQTVICALCVCYVLVLKAFGGEIYVYSRAVFNDNFNQKINIEQVLSSAEAKKVIAAQATVYGTGGGDDESTYLKTKKDISADVNSKIKSSHINAMCIPVIGKITSEYDYRYHPISGSYSFHAGLDIGADSGTDIRSALGGTVEAVDTKGDETTYGKYIKVLHSSGVETLYGHCSKIIAGKGDKINKGDVIAKVGSTGNSTGPHLHFEVRVNGIRLNPRWFIEI